MDDPAGIATTGEGRGAPGGMVPEDVWEVPAVLDPRLSPDGRTVAFVIARQDRERNGTRSDIWMAPVDGSAPARRFTAGTGRSHSPRWSPDGARLAFVSDRDREAGQLHLIPADGGEALRLTDLPEEVGEVTWSADGTRLAFTARVPDPADEEKDPRRRAPRRISRLQYKLDDVGWIVDRPRHVFVVAADGSGPAVQVTHGDAEDAGPSWSPDGRLIAFAAQRHADWDRDILSDVYVVDAGGGEPRRLTATDGIHEAPSWSPDGRSLAVRLTPGGFADQPRHGQIAVVDAADGTRRVLTASLDRNCVPYPAMREPIWVGDHLLFALEDRGDVHLYRVRADGGTAPEPVVDGPVAVAGYDALAGVVVHVASTPTVPGDLYAGGARLTDVGRAFAAARALVEPERFTVETADGQTVDAWIVRPAGLRPGARHPTLLSIHGGPFTQYGTRFLDEFQVWAGAGYAVIYANPRGSSGGTEEWGRAIRGPANEGPGWGTVDHDDLVAVLDEALERFPFCDPDRLGVLGGSYGGYMTTWIVSHSDRFRVACSERACNSLYSQFGSSDFGWALCGYLGAFPWEDADATLRHSPLSRATAIRTPLLILHSEDDLRCAVEQAEQLFVTLRILGREVEMLRFPGEGHELSRSGSPVHRVMRFEAILGWLARHMEPAVTEPAVTAAGPGREEPVGT